MERHPTLSINEWAVLGVLVDRPRHDYDIVAELPPGTPIGDALAAHPPARLPGPRARESLGMAEAQRTEPSTARPPRTIYDPTGSAMATQPREPLIPAQHH